MDNTFNLVLRADNNRKTTDKYKFINTDVLVERVSQVLADQGLNSQYVIKSSRGAKTTRHIVDFRFDQTVNFLGDQVNPRIIIINSYNGESALQVRVGLYRLVCSNGLIVGQDWFTERIIHLKGLTTDQKLAVLNEKVLAAIRYIQQKLNGLEPVLSRKLTLVQELNIVSSLGLADKHVNNIHNMLLSPYRASYLRPADNTSTVWGLYNVINENIKGKTQYTNDIKNLNLMDKIVKLAA